MGVDSPVSAQPSCDEDVKALQLIEEMTTNADVFQQRVLAEILHMNHETEYLRRFGLDGATDRDTFKRRVPMVSYEDIQPEIHRIANGESSHILSASHVSEFLTSSGTSAGERKLIPTTQEEQNRRRSFAALATSILNRFVKGLDKGKGLYILFIKSETKTPSGLLARPAVTSMLKSEQFKNRPDNLYTSPTEIFLCPNPSQSIYSHLLCGLYDRLTVLRIGAIFASSLLHAIAFLRLNWPQLAHDIRCGTLNSRITDPSIRSSMARIMRPDPVLADLIATECSNESWEGIIPRIWPNTKYLDGVVTGSMSQYIPALDFYGGGLPLVSAVYASSECFFGLNLNPICKPNEVSYTIMPNMAYFEFLPVDQAELVDLVDVEIGKEYEIVVTTYAGLYRYRVGDILRVTGFHNSAPMFHFVRRKNVLLSIDSDKTDEAELQRAVDVASELLRSYDARVGEYTSCVDTQEIPGHYVIYWELMRGVDSGGAVPGHVMEACCLAIEESLNSVYRQCRVLCGSIGALEIRVVRGGTFEELMEQAVSRGASMSQYKVARCVSFKPILELLDSRVESVHFSPGLPHWTQSVIDEF